MRLFLLSLMATTIFLFSCEKPQKIEKKKEVSVKEIAYPVYEKPYELPYDKDKVNNFKQDKQKLLQTFFRGYWELNKVSGGLLVAKNGQIIYEKYIGMSNKAKQTVINEHTPIHIASVSKVLTGIAVLKLIEKGKLSLDEPVSKVLPSFKYKDITIENLLSHRSGLPNYAYFSADKKWWKQGEIKNNQEVLSYLNQTDVELYNPPGTAFSYSNTNYAILALIIEKITQEKYPIAMEEMVFKPFGMQDTFVFNIKDSAKVSQSYTFKGKHWEFNDLDNIYGDKNIYSTPRDLLKLDKAMYSANFLNPELRKEMKKGYSYEQKGVKNYGLGIRMMEWDTGQKLLYHNGWWHGNYSTYVRGESDTISIIALGNQKNRSVYSAFSLAGVLGDFPVGFEEEEIGGQSEKDTILLAKKEEK